jgi:hypothetical protein
MATNKPQDDFQKQGVRIPRDLHERIHEAARKSGRSYNSELIARLEYSFEGWPFPKQLQDEVATFATEQHVSFAEALERIIYLGTRPQPPIFGNADLKATGPAPELKQLLEDVAAIKRDLHTFPVHLIYDKAGALQIYGNHQIAFFILMEAGIEAEEKHDRHMVSEPHAAEAERVLQAHRLIQVVSVSDERRMAAQRVRMRVASNVAEREGLAPPPASADLQHDVPEARTRKRAIDLDMPASAEPTNPDQPRGNRPRVPLDDDAPAPQPRRRTRLSK